MEERELTLGSLFSGSGGFELGGMLSGIRPVWNAEVEPFPVRVTEKRLPEVMQLGDVKEIDGGAIPPVDIITFGSPCQDMSIAGRREGLDGSRSALFYEAIRIIKEMRGATDGEYPRFAVWENVKGALSSNGGGDFGAVLREFCRVKEPDFPVPGRDGWKNAGCILGDTFSVAWRLLDAQYWGVPQRRERIYLVADFADRGAGKILFESEGLSGYSPEGLRAWQEAARGAAEGPGETGRVCLNDQGGERMDVTDDVTCTLRAEAHHPPVVMDGGPAAAGFCTEHSARARGIGYGEEKSPTLRAGTVPAAMMFENHSQDSRYRGPLSVAQSLTARNGTGGNNQPFVMQPEPPRAFGVCSKASHAMTGPNPESGFYEAGTSRCLDANGGNPTCNQGGIAVVEDNPSYGLDRAAFNQGRNAKFGFTVKEEVEPAIVARGPNAVGHPIYHGSKASYFTNFTDSDAAPTLVATDYKDPPAVSAEPYYTVRRLTPVECARLQGFPDRWCDGLESGEPTDEEIRRWTDIFETHRKAAGKTTKPRTENQVRKWLRNPYSDSAAYRMWGNGVALPNVVFVLSGIVWAARGFPT